MRYGPIPVRCIVIGIFILSLSACAVLTTSQVQEVKRFSQTTDAYIELPGELIRSYGELERDSILLALSRKEFSPNNTQNTDEAWDKIEKAYNSEHDLDALGKRMDGALAVLKIYSELLNQLVSDDYTDALGESSVSLGKSLDNVTDEYNQKYGATKPLPSVGSEIAESIRFSGGLYIRYRQTKILRETIAKADPLIQNLMKDVGDIATRMETNFQASERSHIERPFKDVANESGRLPVTTLLFVYNGLFRARTEQELAKKVSESANAYATAHQALVDNTRKRRNLKELIAEIQTLRSEVNAAKDIKSKMEK